MSGYSIDTDNDEMDNYYDSDYDFTSNFRFNKYSAENQKSNFEDDDSEDFGKPITVTMPIKNIDKLQHESDTNQMSLNAKINQVVNTQRKESRQSNI
jgi:hypothetical protein